MRLTAGDRSINYCHALGRSRAARSGSRAGAKPESQGEIAWAGHRALAPQKGPRCRRGRGIGAGVGHSRGGDVLEDALLGAGAGAVGSQALKFAPSVARGVGRTLQSEAVPAVVTPAASKVAGALSDDERRKIAE